LTTLDETASTAADASGLMLPGYYAGADGSWRTLPIDFPEDDPAVTSLAWGVIDWCETWLVHHLTGGPWQFTRGQLGFLLRWYAVDANGRFLYRRGIRRGAKGTGKDPFGAAWANVELCGPVRYSHHDDAGRPVGVPHRLALVQIAANSADQAKDVLRVANAMQSQRMRDEYGIDPGATRTQTATGSRIEVLTASESSSEGDPATAILLNETHHMTESNGGLKIAAVAQRNVGKSPRDMQARLLSLTNAHRQGSESRAEIDFEAWQAQVGGNTRTGKQDILYDSIEAPPDIDMTDPEDLRRGIIAAYSDAPWSDIERLCDEANDPATSVADLIRFYLNSLAARRGLLGETRRRSTPSAGPTRCSRRPRRPDRGVLRRVEERRRDRPRRRAPDQRRAHHHARLLAAAARRTRQGLARPAHEVDAKVQAMFERYTVVAFYGDPSPATDDETEQSYWMPLLDEWHQRYRDQLAIWGTPGHHGHAVLFDMRLSKPGGTERNRRFTETAMRTVVEIEEDVATGATPPLTHDGDGRLRQHVHNARRRPNQWGVRSARKAANRRRRSTSRCAWSAPGSPAATTSSAARAGRSGQEGLVKQ
jgi:hypothetical protein